MRRATALLIALAGLLTMAGRWRLLDIAMERDEGEYAYMGQLLLSGIAPYGVQRGVETEVLFQGGRLLLLVWMK